ncbi:MAG: beta-galactosidase [Treponema sp.]|nr:beta-galactosidase [Treponema sp.]
MEQTLFFGAAYYPEYIPHSLDGGSTDRIEKDISMMQAAGMNIIRIAESTWSTEEPSDGTFDFSYVDKVLAVLEKHGMKAIIGTPTYATPSWLIKKDPSIMVTRKDGQALYGMRQSMDILNPTFLFHAERIIRKLIEHVARHPAVCGYQIDNETKHYGNYGQHAQQKFKEYIKEKFKTPQQFNDAFRLAYWSNSISTWDDLPDMRGCINGGLACEYERFLRTCVANYLLWQSKIVSEYKREDQFITHNFDFEWRKTGSAIAQDGYSYGVQPDAWHLEESRAVTLTGTDIYHPTQDFLTGAEIAFGGDSIRTLKQQGYLVVETQAQAFKHWTPYPGQLKLQAYSHLASGAKGVMYWSWQSIHNGFETYWKGLLSHNLEPNPIYNEAAAFGAEWKKLGTLLSRFTKKNRVALVTDNLSLSSFKWFPIHKDISYNDVVRWMFDSLYEMNIECDIIDIHALETSHYDMIVVPALYCASEESLCKLKSFVSNGGVMVSSFKSFVADEQSTVYDDNQPHLLTDCLGITYSQFVQPHNMMLAGSECTGFAELLVPTTAHVVSAYTHRYWGNYAGITKNAFGKGIAYHVGSFISKDALKQVLWSAAETVHITESIPPFTWPIIVRSGTNEEGKKLHFILHYSQDQKNISCPYAAVYDALTGEKYTMGDSIILHDWDVKILAEEQ